MLIKNKKKRIFRQSKPLRRGVKFCSHFIIYFDNYISESLGSRSREVGRKDSAGSRSRSPSEGSENEGDDDLENMRRKLLADRKS